MSKTILRLDETDLQQRRLNRRDFLLGTASVAGGLTLASCSMGSTANGPVTTPSGKNYTIALIVGQKGNAPFYDKLAKGAQAEAAAKGMTLLVDGPAAFNPATQVGLVDPYIAKKVDAIIIAPADSNALIAPLKKANDLGIKVITVDTYIGDGDYTGGKVTFPLSYIGSDNTLGGQKAAEALIRSIGGKGKIYIQSTVAGISSEDQRIAGFKATVEQTNGAVTIAGINYDEGDTAKATEQITAILQRDDAAAIFGTNFFSCDGAAAALKNANKAGMVKLAYFDATPNAITNLRNGFVTIVIAQFPGDMGKMSVDYAMNALNGQSVPKHTTTNYFVITKDNIDTPEAQAAVYGE